MGQVEVVFCEELSREVKEACKKNNVAMEQFFFDAVKLHLHILKELQLSGEVLEIQKKPIA